MQNIAPIHHLLLCLQIPETQTQLELQRGIQREQQQKIQVEILGQIPLLLRVRQLILHLLQRSQVVQERVVHPLPRVEAVREVTADHHHLVLPLRVHLHHRHQEEVVTAVDQVHVHAD